ncbi:unnamed protein product [Miscanthus lutarioriparius]|uniref:EF-hand domain-containing protein n=1 Tax=Miscanthus lutarioriparius TaxID=422564 RepID=A0A811N7V8_9POAL|nr:unnamed protein product [Miscanthus lutarioriparius]
MATIGLAAAGRGEGLDDVRGLFDAEEPSFTEVRAVFAVFDADRDGFIGAEDLQGALARLGIRQDAAACRAMVVAAGGGRDARMNLFQFVRQTIRFIGVKVNPRGGELVGSGLTVRSPPRAPGISANFGQKFKRNDFDLQSIVWGSVPTDFAKSGWVRSIRVTALMCSCY